MLITSLKSTYSRSKLYFGLIASVIISGGLFLTYVQPGTIFTDGGIFSAVAFKDLNGGKLYHDTWENKPPGIFYLMELFYILVPDPVYALFIMALVIIIGIGIALFYLFYRYFESLSISLLFLCLSLYFTVNENNIKDGLYTEIYGTFCLLASLVFFEYSRKREEPFSLALAGILLGFSFWFKEPFILICIPLWLYYAIGLKNRKPIIRVTGFALLPSLLFIILLSLDGSTGAFLDTFLYNFTYSAQQENNSLSIKWNDYYRYLFYPVLGLLLLSLYILYKNATSPKTRHESLVFTGIFIASTLFVFLAPYNLGHYYFPSFVLLFVVIAKQFQLYKVNQHSLNLPLVVLMIYYIYRIDHSAHPKFTYRIRPYQPDRITERLLNEKDATLFVDYVTMGAYYVKARKTHPAFVPVALPVHFDTSARGKKNTARIWQDLSVKPADYLITTYTTSYFSWHLPETKFYVENYEKIDSVFPPDEFVIYLWKYKKR